MRILKIIHTRGHGGAENVFRWLARALMDAGHEVVAGIPLDNEPRDPERWLARALQEVGVPCRTFDRRGSGRALIREFMSLIRKVRPDIVHSHLLDSNFYSAVACRRLGVPHVSTEHGDVALKRDLASRAKFYLLPVLSGTVVCVSEAVRKHATDSSPFPGRLDLIYNGMAFDAPIESTFREEAGIPQAALVIGNVGNLYPVKGQRHLIEAFGILRRTLPEARLVLVGRGGERPALETLAAQLGIERAVVFTGFRPDVGNVLGALDIYVQPSLSEGLPMAVLEALGRGLPVVATDVGGVREILCGEVQGILVRPGSPEELAAAIHAIAADRSRWASTAGARLDFVREKFSVDAMSRSYLRLYRRILRRHAA